MTEIGGFTAPGFEPVRAAFQRNFDDGLEIGASFAAYHRGEKVVDLWAGVADPATGRPWNEDTIILVYSTTKGVTAACANRLIQNGAIDPDAPVAQYWPEFAANGKDDITVAHILSHQAGLAWIDGEMTAEEAFAWDPVIEALQRQAPSWVPGTKHGYHATTYGWLVGEVIRRVTGVSVGAYLRDEIADPLGLDLWIGLPEEQEPRVAPIGNLFPEGVTMDGLREPGDDEIMTLVAQFVGPDTPLGKSLFAPGYALATAAVWNTRAMRAAEIPSVNAITDARSLARLYAGCIGEIDGFRVLSEEQLKRATTQQTFGPNSILLEMDIQFGLGFMLHSSLITLGGAGSFGHFGAGGSMGWADPDAELAFGYVMNRMDLGLAGDMRSFRLVNACYDAVR